MLPSEESAGMICSAGSKPKKTGETEMTPQEAIRRAESIVLKDYQTLSTQEAREIMAGLLKALDEKILEAK